MINIDYCHVIRFEEVDLFIEAVKYENKEEKKNQIKFNL